MRDLENFNELVDIFASLPGIGKKSALRLAFRIALEDKYLGARMSHAIEKCLESVGYCSFCGGISEHELCDVCSDESRDRQKLCIVENPKDILLLESIKAFDGRYFVFKDRELSLLKLQDICAENKIKEIVFAFTPSIASDGLMIYIEDRLNKDIEFTKIAQGVPTGVSLENIDAISLLRAMERRVKA